MRDHDQDTSHLNKRQKNKQKEVWCQKHGIELKRMEEMKKIKKNIEKILYENHNIVFDNNRHLYKTEIFNENDAIDQYYVIKVKNKILKYYIYFF